jgi:AraC-like DNA-binding protein
MMRADITPVQPFFLVNTHKYYKMRAPGSPIVHYYSYTADMGRHIDTVAVPDGCVDIMFSTCGGVTVGRVYGTVTKCSSLEIENGAEYFGVRFLPGQMPERLDVSIPELIDGSIPIDEFKGGRDLLERVAATADFAGRIKHLRDFIGDGWRTDSFLGMMISEVISRSGNMRVSELESETMYTARYINQVFNGRLGLSPKEFMKFIRFQSLIGRMNTGGGTLTDLALDSGYYDQSHFIKEFKEFASVTPREYAKVLDLPNYQKKIVYIA